MMSLHVSCIRGTPVIFRPDTDSGIVYSWARNRRFCVTQWRRNGGGQGVHVPCGKKCAGDKQCNCPPWKICALLQKLRRFDGICSKVVNFVFLNTPSAPFQLVLENSMWKGARKHASYCFYAWCTPIWPLIWVFRTYVKKMLSPVTSKPFRRHCLKYIQKLPAPNGRKITSKFDNSIHLPEMA